MSIFHFLPSALMFFHCFMVTYTVTTRNLTTDQSVLLEFKHQINDPHGILVDNWSTSHSFCNWIGVTCGAKHKRIKALNLPNMNLIGTIPPELGDLSFLASLNLSGNGFHGDLQEELGQLSRLKLVDLSSNFFIGEIPSSFGRLNQVSDLVLSNNNLTGAIPPEISNLLNTRTLDLASNKLSGSIPSSI
ncbi:probable LRR receptor-like serine/threonine-protein kinase At3g47570 [Gossypium arboreum]|uniref:probable LRR receptor-like serine/threonine-protein kinase At3g47570 n=1 Tax=Gossypium arboreum TaxID=29729 RepID=UPI0008196E19|nr:probable LRR receptor-like serine/threonine-protein kinase At3g47570 [Gossypium arboreum]